MFICDLCGNVSKPGDKPQRQIAAKREKTYFDSRGKELGKGWEIEKEILVCELGCEERAAQEAREAEEARQKAKELQAKRKRRRKVKKKFEKDQK